MKFGSPDCLRMIRSNQYRYMRCHERNSSVPCSHVRQAGNDAPGGLPWIAAWYSQLSGFEAGNAFIAVIAFAYATSAGLLAESPPTSIRVPPGPAESRCGSNSALPASAAPAVLRNVLLLWVMAASFLLPGWCSRYPDHERMF